MNKSILWMGSAVLFLAISSFLGNYVTAEPTERVIKITAKVFEYTLKEITLKKGEPVVLELTSLDLFHGFNITEMASVPNCHRAKPRVCSLRRTRPEASLLFATISAAPAMKT